MPSLLTGGVMFCVVAAYVVLVRAIACRMSRLAVLVATGGGGGGGTGRGRWEVAAWQTECEFKTDSKCLVN